MKIVQLTDCHLLKNPNDTLWNIDLDRQLKAVVKKANEEHPDMVLLTGDLSQDGSPESYQRLSEIISVFTCPVYAIHGNHDDAPMFTTHLRALKADCVDHPHFRLVFTDSVVPGETPGYLSDENLLELRAAIDTLIPTYVVLHHHPLPITPEADKYILKNYDAFLSLLVGMHVKAVIFGHIHHAFDVMREGIRFLGCPSTSVQFGHTTHEESLPGYRVMIIDESGDVETHIKRVSDY